ncbi:hypothetical protein [Xenorhabdus sp. KJ12.1]|uniref:hypothetical protein n=1 Tax=Xenorhabdus sp. KJ12.1 TaxID=1851571 RepID=UPI00129012B0|nr:hypothetical protein [Xenorhabdus sp. KJ12.1]
MSSTSGSALGAYELATRLAKSLEIQLVEYNNIPEPEHDDWNAADVLTSLTELSVSSLNSK